MADGNTNAADFKPGTVISGHYRVKSVLGRGGMGVVYRVEHMTMLKDFALKALAPDQINAANWQRFLLEGKAIARLEHRNIVKIYDMAIHDDRPFYVMDLLSGPSLAEYIMRNGALDSETMLFVFKQICSGLGFAHQNGIIHRDIKPSNIILTELEHSESGSAGGAHLSFRPLVKVVDFGLVKLVGSAVGDGPIQSQTATGEVFGSPYYMSPEQCLGIKVDARSDIYSLGCTLFESLTGRPPLRGANAMQTVMMHQNQTPPQLQSVYPQGRFSAALESTVAQMLKKRPEERQQSLAAVLRELERIGEGKSVKPQAIYAESQMFTESDLRNDDDDHSKGGSAALFKIFALVSIVIVVLAAVGVGSYSYFLPRPKLDIMPVIEVSEDDRRIADAKQAFESCGTISNGKANIGGGVYTRFSFPGGYPLGVLCWGKGALTPYDGREAPAQHSQIKVPAGDDVALKISPSVGRFTLLFPFILKKFGSEDIQWLMVNQDKDIDPSVTQNINSNLSARFFEAIVGWRALKSISIHHFVLDSAATKALYALKPVGELKLRGCKFDTAVLAQMPWLNYIETLDLKGARNIDLILKALSGSTSLKSLSLDQTEPGADALRLLSTCKNLRILSLPDCDIEASKLKAVASISTLQTLNLNGSRLKDDSLQYLEPLKKLRSVSLKNCQLSEAGIEAFHRAHPHITLEN